MHPEPRRSRAVLGLLLLAAVTLITLDTRGGPGRSPIAPLRSAVAAVLGPIEDAATAAFRPVTNLPGHFRDVDALRRENASLQAANEELTQRLRLAGPEAGRLSELSGLSKLADTSDLTVVPAQVVAIGPAQSFSRTVTIDAGTSDGVGPDLTVINADGLVGRVISANRSTATVLLIIDAKSTVGGRLGASMELGFLDGDGDLSSAGSLDMSLVDHRVSPRPDDVVVSWGSRNHAPYIAGVPIGSVTSVTSSPAELTQTATIEPFVDFSSLDVVGVVTADGRAAADVASAGPR